MAIINLLYAKKIKINEKVSVVIPTVGQVLDNEEEYYSILYSITATPMDLMLELDEAGIDFEKIDDYELFLRQLPAFANSDMSLFFENIDFSKFVIGKNEESKEFVLIDTENDIIIDRGVFMQITDALRRIHHLKKNIRKPKNIEAKEYMLERAREKRKRAKRRRFRDSEIEPYIISLVNAPEFKYNYEEIRNLTIYQFNESLYQILHRVKYDKRMIGVMAGTIDTKNTPSEELTWVKTK